MSLNLPSGDPGSLGLGDDLEVWSHLRGARCLRLWHTLELDEAHSAVTCYRESLMVAETGDLDAGLRARLVHRVGAIDFDWLAVDVNIESLCQVLGWSED